MENKDLNFVWLVIGKPMTGKSSFALTFPKPFWVNTDGNHFMMKGNSKIFLNKYEKINIGGRMFHPWEAFSMLVDQDLSDYKTIIIDLIEGMYDLCRDFILKKFNKKHESDIGGYGAGFKAVENEFVQVMEKYAALRYKGFNVIFIGHQKLQEEAKRELALIDENAKPILIYGSMLRDVIENKICGMSQIVGRVDVSRRLIKVGVEEKVHQLMINESRSISGNRLFLKFDSINLTYDDFIKKFNEQEKK